MHWTRSNRSWPGLLTVSLLACSLEARTSAASELERRLIQAGLVRVTDIDPSLLVKLKYAATSNLMGADVYSGLEHCYLQREAAEMLREAHRLLKAEHPGLRLLVVDGCRPRSVQRRLWGLVEGTPRQRYVANPARGSMHALGAAVDLTLADERGNRLDLGTAMDHFGPLAQPRLEERFLREGKLTREQVRARRWLRRAMTRAGFRPLPIEWWHFDAFPRKVARRRYRVIE